MRCGKNKRKQIQQNTKGRGLVDWMCQRKQKTKRDEKTITVQHLEGFMRIKSWCYRIKGKKRSRRKHKASKIIKTWHITDKKTLKMDGR